MSKRFITGWGLGDGRHPSSLKSVGLNLDGYGEDSYSKCKYCDSKFIKED